MYNIQIIHCVCVMFVVKWQEYSCGNSTLVLYVDVNNVGTINLL